MKLLLVALIAVAGLAAVAAQTTTTSVVDDDVAATLGAKWGHWTLERLNNKKAEIKSDIAQTKTEKLRVKEWGKKVAALVGEIGNRHVQAAKERVAEWTDILAVRRGQRNFHVGRKAGYDARHNYIVNGPKGRRAATDKAAWCKAHPVSCDRWHHERALYKAHHYGKLRNQQGAVTAHSRKRVQAAKAQLKKAVDALAAARKWRKNKNAAFAKRATDAVKPWTKRLGRLRTELKAVNAAIKKVKDTRTARLATYKPFYMTKCRYIGGKHHMYYCYLDTNNADKAKHKFRVCKKRGVDEASVGKLKFRCYK